VQRAGLARDVVLEQHVQRIARGRGLPVGIRLPAADRGSADHGERLKKSEIRMWPRGIEERQALLDRFAIGMYWNFR